MFPSMASLSLQLWPKPEIWMTLCPSISSACEPILLAVPSTLLRQCTWALTCWAIWPALVTPWTTCYQHGWRALPVGPEDLYFKYTTQGTPVEPRSGDQAENFIYLFLIFLTQDSHSTKWEERRERRNYIGHRLQVQDICIWDIKTVFYGK